MLGAFIDIGVGIDIAAAHTGHDDHDTDAQHAEQDLVGTSITKIEKDTKLNAAEIKAETGAAPGRRTGDQTVPNVALSSAAATDPGVGGAWSAVKATDVIPVFQAVLPNGKVLIWDSVGDGPTGDYPNHNFARVIVWDPTTDTFKRTDLSGYNIFCAGYTQLADGRVLVAGGNKNPQQDGIIQTHIFDWRTETWTRGPDMAAERWYPSVAALGNDEAVIIGGGPAVPEVYQTNGSLRRLISASGYSDGSIHSWCHAVTVRLSWLGQPTP